MNKDGISKLTKKGLHNPEKILMRLKIKVYLGKKALICRNRKVCIKFARKMSL